MANEILDNRILLTNNNTTDTSLDDAAGSPVGSSDTENFIQGDGSWGQKVSATIEAMMYDAGTAQDWSNNTFYIWAKCSFPIDTFAAGGMRIRFCGATVSDFFEKHVRGVDTGYSGDFTMVVADIERAREDAVAGIDGATGGTTPATNAIRYVGIVFDVPGMVSGNFNNCNVDAMWRLPNAAPGIKIDGQNGGSTPWTMNDIFNAADPGDVNKAWGTVFFQDGVYKVNTPFLFANNDSVTHSFEDSNIVVAWQDALVANNFYSWDIIGGTGSQNFQLGVKSGTGNDATGSQGMTMVADSDGARFSISANNASIDFANFYGCQFVHADSLQFNHANTSVISCLFNDVSVANTTGSADFLRITNVAANTYPDFPLITADFDDMVNCVNEFSSTRGGHAIELLNTGSYASIGNRFSGYGVDESSNAAIVNYSGGSVTINISGGGLASEHTVRNIGLATTSVLATVDVNINVQDTNLTAIANAQVYIQKSSPTTFTPNAGNPAGSSTIVFQQIIDSDIPQSTWATVLDRSLNRTFPYRVASHTANTISLRAEVTGQASSTSNGTHLISSGTNFVTADIEEGDTIRNTTDGSYGVVDYIIDSDTIRLTRDLEGGTLNIWTNLDNFSVHRLATALEVGIDTVDVPLFQGQTDASGDIATLSYDQSAAPTNIIVRTRTVEDIKKGGTGFLSDFRNGTISASTGYTQTITLQEDTQAN